MPTENRSSNTEMVSVPEGFMLVERSIWTEKQVDAATACITRLKGVPTMTDRALAMAAIDAAQCTAPDIALSDLLPAPQPHPEPIAWMVGTAFWWTKEEAERDAAEAGLPIVGLGPMTGIATAEKCQGEPAGEVVAFGKGLHEIAWASGRMPGLGAKLYTHADPGEVERLREGISKHWKVVCDQRAELETLRTQLAEQDSLLREVLEAFKLETDGSCINPGRDFIRPWAAKLAALSASAEPSAPNDCAICRDLGNQCMECEEGEFREWADRHFAAADYRKTDAGVFIQDWMRHAYGAWCARGALTSKQ